MTVGRRAEERESRKSDAEMVDARLQNQCKRKLTEEQSECCCRLCSFPSVLVLISACKDDLLFLPLCSLLPRLVINARSCTQVAANMAGITYDLALSPACLLNEAAKFTDDTDCSSALLPQGPQFPEETDSFDSLTFRCS